MDILIRQAKQGDRKAMRTLLCTHHQLLKGVVGKFLWDADRRDDVMQNICLKVLRAIAAFKGNCQFATWLYRIAVNECFEFNRRKYTVVSKGNDMDVFPDPDAADGLSDLNEKELRERIYGCIAGLPEGMRIACELYYMEQYSGSEAARKLKISAQAFFVRLSAARARLKDDLIRKGIVS